MATIKVAPGKLGAVIKADGKNLPKVAMLAMRKAAARGAAHLASKTPVDRGMLKNAWRVVKLASAIGGGYEILNDAPYAGVVERGIRPGQKFGRAAFDAIKAWVIRKILVAKAPGQKKPRAGSKAGAAMDAEADAITWAIIKKLEKFGRAGKFFIKAELPDLTVVLTGMIVDEITAYFAKGGGTKGGGP